jgi:thioredoxin-like negative regulator of GroEL
MTEFRRALAMAPGRSRSLLGLARAAIARGDKRAALEALVHLGRNWALADPKAREELAPLRRLADRLP